MSLTEDIEAMKSRFESLKAQLEQHLEQDLPALASFASTAASNPVTVAIAGAVHLPEAPEVLETFAALITKADAALGAQKAAGAAEAQAAAAEAQAAAVAALGAQPEAPAPA